MPGWEELVGQLTPTSRARLGRSLRPIHTHQSCNGRRTRHWPEAETEKRTGNNLCAHNAQRPSAQEPYTQEPENKLCAHNTQRLSAQKPYIQQPENKLCTQKLGDQEPEKKPNAQQEPYIQKRENMPCAQNAHEPEPNLCQKHEHKPCAQEQKSEQDSANTEFFFLCSLNGIEWPGVASHVHLV